MMGAGGCIPAQQEYLTALRRRCDETGSPLIFDEVMTSRMIWEVSSSEPEYFRSHDLGKILGRRNDVWSIRWAR